MQEAGQAQWAYEAPPLCTVSTCAPRPRSSITSTSIAADVNLRPVNPRNSETKCTNMHIRSSVLQVRASWCRTRAPEPLKGSPPTNDAPQQAFKDSANAPDLGNGELVEIHTLQAADVHPETPIHGQPQESGTH